ncbi:MAG: DUF3568 family protein [Pedosphaera sp.]|nr:DUF3568 family protein [Pedosphaera sp.]
MTTMTTEKQPSSAILLPKHLQMLLLGASLLAATGCAAVLVGGVAAGAGAVAYVRGELKSVEAAPLEKTWTATLAAVKQLEFAITDRSKDGLSAKLSARGSGDRRIQVELAKSGEKMTEVRIRVGVFGNETLSRQILEKIKSRL